jgi:hypothetical protein
MDQTRVIFSVENKSDYIIDLDVSPDKACFRDFKQTLKECLNINIMSYVFYFKVIDEKGGESIQLILDDSTKLPNEDGIVISWLKLRREVDADNVAPNYDFPQGKISF